MPTQFNSGVLNYVMAKEIRMTLSLLFNIVLLTVVASAVTEPASRQQKQPL
jgi:hypothetical protein